MKKLRKLRQLKEPIKLKDLDTLVEQISFIINESKKEFKKIKEGCNKLGIEDKTFDAIIQGKDIIDCIYCNTHNMCEIFYNQRDKWTMYECYKCNKSYMVLDTEKE